MLNSSEFVFTVYQDNRQKSKPGFTVGRSGPLLIAKHKATGKKYLVKHTYGHNAANEYVACWLAKKIGVPTPDAQMLSPDGPFGSKYAVAISFIEGFTTFDKTNVPAAMQDDLIGQFALNLLIATEDILQMNAAGGHIYSYDFSEGFHVTSEGMLRAFLFNIDKGIEAGKRKLSSYRGHLERMDFDIPGLAREFHLDPEKQKTGMIATARRVLGITEQEIVEMSDELMEMYPLGYAVYYEECIHSMQKRMEALD